jgi:hypothetical protein
MLYNNIQETLEKAQKRLGSSTTVSLRKRRSDRGKSRMPSALIKKINTLISARERPRMRTLLAEIKKFCIKHKFPVPTRATIYSYIKKAPVPLYHPDQLPEQVKASLYNLDLNTPVPGHQLAFYCFNYGDLKATSYAAGLPWLPLYQAAHMRGFRPKSRGLLQAVLHKRGI